MAQTIRVRILNRDFSLVVEEEDEHLTRRIASYVDDRIQEFRRSHPEQPELTAAVIAAMAITEELFTARNERERLEDRLDDELDELAEKLGRVLAVNGDGASERSGSA